MTQQMTRYSSHCSSDADRSVRPHQPPPPPTLCLVSVFTSAGLCWFQKHLELFSVRYSCSHRLAQDGGRGFHKNHSDPPLERGDRKWNVHPWSFHLVPPGLRRSRRTRHAPSRLPTFCLFQTRFSHFARPSEVPQVESCWQEQGGGRRQETGGGGGHRRVHSDKARPSCQLLLQQLLPLLFPQGLQVIRPLHSSLSEDRDTCCQSSAPQRGFLISHDKTTPSLPRSGPLTSCCFRRQLTVSSFFKMAAFTLANHRNKSKKQTHKQTK